MSCVPDTRFDHIVISSSVKRSESSVAQNMNSFMNLPLLCTLVEIMVYFRTQLDFSAVELSCPVFSPSCRI